MTPAAKSIALSLAIITAACAISWALYWWTDADCKARGGHTEVVWGGRVGWTCSGAQP